MGMPGKYDMVIAFANDFAALVIVDRPLTAGETADLTTWLNAEVGL